MPINWKLSIQLLSDTPRWLADPNFPSIPLMHPTSWFLMLHETINWREIRSVVSVRTSIHIHLKLRPEPWEMTPQIWQHRLPWAITSTKSSIMWTWMLKGHHGSFPSVLELRLEWQSCPHLSSEWVIQLLLRNSEPERGDCSDRDQSWPLLTFAISCRCRSRDKWRHLVDEC